MTGAAMILHAVTYVVSTAVTHFTDEYAEPQRGPLLSPRLRAVV